MNNSCPLARRKLIGWPVLYSFVKYINYKKKWKKLNPLLFAVILLSMASCTQKAQDEHHYLVILSMDGFRWDYPEKVETPNLDAIATYGVRAERFIPSFPTTTFASHYTMATGLHPDHHAYLWTAFTPPTWMPTSTKVTAQRWKMANFTAANPFG